MDALFARILDGGDSVFYRHEQKGDNDLTEVEKREILSRVFAESKPVFLQRYIRYMEKADAHLFANTNNPLVDFYIERLNRPSATAVQKKNRRFNTLQKLKKEGVFFSDEKMREREPLLYDRMVGRFLSEDEQLNLRPTVEATLSNGWAHLLTQFEESSNIAQRRAQGLNGEWDSDRRKTSDRLMAHVSRAFEMEEEDEEESESTEEGPAMTELQKEVNGIIQRMDENDEREDVESMEEDVNEENLRKEFMNLMYERFLQGGDSAFFDYSAGDNDDLFDDVDPIAERDREEAWFDED